MVSGWVEDRICVGYEGSRSIWLIPRKGGATRQLTELGHDDVGASWSPDGQHVVFSRDGKLALVRSDGTGVRLLAQEGSLPAWQP